MHQHNGSSAAADSVPATVPALLADRAATDPDRVALAVEGGGAITYAAWERRSAAVAAGLAERGVRAGDAVGLVFPPDGWVGLAAAYVGVQRARAVAVPLGPHLGPDTLAAALRQCGVVGTVSGVGEPLRDVPGWQVGPDEVELVDAAGPAPDVRPADRAQILHTSGTTGRPKAVAATHANLTHGLRRRPRPLAHSRHCLHAFVMGSNAGQRMLVGALVAAPTTVVLPSFTAEAFAACIARLRVGSVFVVPSMAVALVNAHVDQRHDLSSVLLLGSTAAALPPPVALTLARWMPDATITNTYSSTEASPAELTTVFDPARPTALGRPDGTVALRITDEQGRDLPAGAVGEVWLRSAAAPRGYVGDPARTGPASVDGWVAMGDLGHVDGDGYVHLVDRADDVVKSGGLKVSTLRVEAALLEHPAVAEAAVVAVPHPVLGQVPAAAVVAAASDPPDLHSFLREKLDRHELPAVVRYVESLPRNAAGKVVKSRLRRELAPAAPRPVGPEPQSPTERDLAELWRRLLDRGAVGTDDDFFALGGDSLRAEQLVVLARERFGVPVPADLAFDTRDLRGQAARIDRQRAGAGPRPDAAGTTPPPPAPEARPGDLVPLSSLQLHLVRWMHRTSPPRDGGTIFEAFRVQDDLDVPLLSSCLSELVHRHHALRTRCVAGPAGWTGRLLPDLAPEVVTPAGAGGPGAAGVDEWFRTQVARPVEWRTGPLVRLVAARRGPREHLVALVVHHVAIDAWSIGVLLRELGELYSARRSGTAPVLAEPVQAAAIVAGQRERWPAEREWWRERLRAAPAAVEHFPGRRFTERYAPADTELVLGAHLQEAARAHRTTAFVVAAAGWLTVLRDHSGADELVVLTPAAARSRPEFESAVGCLAQSLFVRVALADDPTLGQLIGRLRDGLLTAVDHQAYPMAEFGAAVPYPVEILFGRWSRHSHLPGLVSEPHPLPYGLVWGWPLPGGDRGVPKLDLTERPDGALAGRLSHNRHALDAEVVAGLAANLQEVLAPDRLRRGVRPRRVPARDPDPR